MNVSRRRLECISQSDPESAPAVRERESRESSAPDKKEGIIVSALLWSDMSVLVLPVLFFFFWLLFQYMYSHSHVLSNLFALLFYHRFSLFSLF